LQYIIKICDNVIDNISLRLTYEEQEEGVSGHKVRAESRDKLQIIKSMAVRGEFDIFLVFMFDRIGRIADETPFVVEWFCKHGIQVWSTQEGEQRFDNHTDKLLNYIRFWQADGESEKTSIRTRTSLGQLVEAGHFKGGFAAYGYDLVKSGRFNKKKHELLDLQINEEEAAVVRLIFDKYTSEGYGAQRIATYLNRLGYRTRGRTGIQPLFVGFSAILPIPGYFVPATAVPMSCRNCRSSLPNSLIPRRKSGRIGLTVQRNVLPFPKTPRDSPCCPAMCSAVTVARG